MKNLLELSVTSLAGRSFQLSTKRVQEQEYSLFDVDEDKKEMAAIEVGAHYGRFGAPFLQTKLGCV